MQPVIGHIHRLHRIRIFVSRVKGNARILGIGVIPVPAGLWIFKMFEMYEVRHGELCLVVEVDETQVLVVRNGPDGFGYLFEGLAVLVFVGAIGVVLWVVLFW